MFGLRLDRAGALGAGAAMLSVLALVLVSRLPAPDIRLYVALTILGAGATYVALARSKNISASALLLVAALAHVIALFGAAAFENDYFRFIWDGWRLLETGSPYGVAPEDFFLDPNVPPELHRVLDGVNYPEYSTIYGPVLEALFALAFLISGTDPWALRILFALANLALIALLLRRAPAHQVALYAWSPFVIAEIVLHVHPDGIMALFLAVALLAAATRPALAGVALGFAAGAKIVALAAFPLLLRLPPRAGLAACAALAMLYAPFLLQPHGAGFETTAMFAQDWHFNPLLYAPINALLPEQAARLVCGAIGIALIVWLHARTRDAGETPLAPIFGAVLLVSAVVNPWYLLWVLPFAVQSKALWPYAAALALPLSYLTGLNLGLTTMDDFEVHPLAWSAELLILAAALAYDLYRARKASRPIT